MAQFATNQTPEAIAHQIIVHTDVYGGGTFDISGDLQLVGSGVAVARGSGTGAIIDTPETPEAKRSLHATVVQFVTNARNDGGVLKVGTWVDNGAWYVDYVEVYADRALAILTGRTRGEISVYDLDREMEYRCNNDAETLSSLRDLYGITDIPALPID